MNPLKMTQIKDMIKQASKPLTHREQRTAGTHSGNMFGRSLLFTTHTHTNTVPFVRRLMTPKRHLSDTENILSLSFFFSFFLPSSSIPSSSSSSSSVRHSVSRAKDGKRERESNWVEREQYQSSGRSHGKERIERGSSESPSRLPLSLTLLFSLSLSFCVGSSVKLSCLLAFLLPLSITLIFKLGAAHVTSFLLSFLSFPFHAIWSLSFVFWVFSSGFLFEIIKNVEYWTFPVTEVGAEKPQQCCYIFVKLL